MNEYLIEKLEILPDKTGVYLMKDEVGKIIYVGKAKSLRNRVRSYFQKEVHSPKIHVMVPKIADIEFITTDSEAEALILEDILIKKHQPRYNTLLKDDKKFPWIMITDEDYPRILVTRNPSARSKKRKNKYFGPYVSAGALYATIDFLKKAFPLKQCKSPVYRDKPCMNYHINRCLGPCQEKVSPEGYQELLRQIELFLSGRQTKLLVKLDEMMKRASTELEFEKAGKLRDTISAVNKVIETQKVVTDDVKREQDIFAYLNDEINLAVVMFKVREGKLVFKESFDLTIDELDTPEETFWIFIENYYKMIEGEQVPREIVLQWLPEEYTLLEELLTEKKTKKVKIILPKAGAKLELLQMARNNAEIALSNFQQKAINKFQNSWNEIGLIIKEKLGLPEFPVRVECFDISHLGGTDTVASMVVFEAGKPLKSAYRKFKIRKTVNKIDDFASMNEVITRRYSRLKKENIAFPDLIIVDGGKGQLSSSLKALEQIGLPDLSIVSLAKKFEEVFIPGDKEPIIFERNSPGLYFFQQIRDEAHRFAITFQKNLRSKRMVNSRLDSINSVGKKRKAILVEHFGSLEKLYNASIDKLSEVKGISKPLAEKIYQQLHSLP